MNRPAGIGVRAGGESSGTVLGGAQLPPTHLSLTPWPYGMLDRCRC